MTSKESQALDKVTDYVEEAEISEEKAQKAAKDFKAAQKRQFKTDILLNISYKDVKVNDKDVTLLMKELDLDKASATKLLQRNEANVSKALKSFVSS